MYRYLYMCMNYLDVGLNLKKVQHILIFKHVHKHTKNNNKSPTNIINPNVLGKLTLIAISMTLLTQNPHPYFVYLVFFYFCLWLDKSRNCYFLYQCVIMWTVETLQSRCGEHDIRPLNKKKTMAAVDQLQYLWIKTCMHVNQFHQVTTRFTPTF